MERRVRGRPTTAPDQLDLALVGSHGYRAEAEQELVRLGRRSAGWGRDAGECSSAEAMVEGEVQLAALRRSRESLTAARAGRGGAGGRGVSNPEVADRLVLSRHTVKRHLANAMLKLRVNSRVKLAREVSRLRA